MNTPTPTGETNAERQKTMSAMFAHLVMQHTNMALIFLGHMPNPQSGETVQDFEHARYFIDQLEMLELKTKGNLDKQEEAMLKQSLTSLRLSFVDAMNHPQAPSPEGATPMPPAGAAPETPPGPAVDEQETPVTEPVLPGEATPPKPADDAESRKKFSKKY